MSGSSSGFVSLVGAGISAAAALVTVGLIRRAALRDRELTENEQALRYREPLLHAAFNLQTRLYNIGCLTFLQRFLKHGTPAEADYTRHNTAYLIGQYLCWSEILRREAQFVDPVNRRRDRAVMDAMESIREIWTDSHLYRDTTLRLFRGEQRAIGEVLLTETDNPLSRVCPRWDCLGYAAFTRAMRDNDDVISPWFRSLEADVESLAHDLEQHQQRLVALQHALVDLINLLDPAGDRVSVKLRNKLSQGV